MNIDRATAMQSRNSRRSQPGGPPVRWSAWLGEQWTDDEISKAKHVLSCVYEGVDALLTIEEMRELEKRGLVTDIKAKPGVGRYAGRYGFEWTDKLQELIKAIRASSPNARTERPERENL